MPRAVDGTRRKERRKKTLARAKGFKAKRSKLFKTAKTAVSHALQYAYAHRRTRKRDMRSLWIARISAACRPEGITYSRLISGLAAAEVVVNRKVLSNLAIEDAAAFKALCQKAKDALGAAV